MRSASSRTPVPQAIDVPAIRSSRWFRDKPPRWAAPSATSSIDSLARRLSLKSCSTVHRPATPPQPFQKECVLGKQVAQPPGERRHHSEFPTRREVGPVREDALHVSGKLRHGNDDFEPGKRMLACGDHDHGDPLQSFHGDGVRRDRYGPTTPKLQRPSSTGWYAPPSASPYSRNGVHGNQSLNVVAASAITSIGKSTSTIADSSGSSPPDIPLARALRRSTSLPRCARR